MTATTPLVSIGVPTYNRPELLDETLTRLREQTYSNVEIVVSDNGSSNPRVIEVLEAHASSDGRIRFSRHETTVHPFLNFIEVLRRSRGEFFKWAADDDRVEDWYIERCLGAFSKFPTCALVAAEAQYFEKSNNFPFVPEGEGFRSPTGGEAAARMKHLLIHNFGNLVYGLFRRRALVRNGEVLWANTRLSSLNEIAPLLLAAEVGEIVVLPEIGLYKDAPRAVYDQVLWEIAGGRHPVGPCLNPRSMWATARYHLETSADIDSAIALSRLSSKKQSELRWLSRRRLCAHLLYLLVGYKPRSTPSAQ